MQLWNEDNHHWAPRPKDEAIREIFKRDKMGRVRVSRARREALLNEFERGGLAERSLLTASGATTRIASETASASASSPLLIQVWKSSPILPGHILVSGKDTTDVLTVLVTKALKRRFARFVSVK